jgi:hypothetical protein
VVLLSGVKSEDGEKTVEEGEGIHGRDGEGRSTGRPAGDMPEPIGPFFSLSLSLSFLCSAQTQMCMCVSILQQQIKRN